MRTYFAHPLDDDNWSALLRLGLARCHSFRAHFPTDAILDDPRAAQRSQVVGVPGLARDACSTHSGCYVFSGPLDAASQGVIEQAPCPSDRSPGAARFWNLEMIGPRGACLSVEDFDVVLVTMPDDAEAALSDAGKDARGWLEVDLAAGLPDEVKIDVSEMGELAEMMRKRFLPDDDTDEH